MPPQAVLLLLMLTICGNLAFTVIIRPSFGIIALSIAIGMGVGLAFGLLYYQNVRSKKESCNMVSPNLSEVPRKAAAKHFMNCSTQLPPE